MSKPEERIDSCFAKIRNAKSEMPNKFKRRMYESAAFPRVAIGISTFGFDSDFVLGVSDLFNSFLREPKGNTMAQQQRQFIVYSRARREIRDADLLLFRRRGVISIFGRGEHSHAAKAAWWDGDLFCLEVREWHGGRAVTLSSQVRRFPCRIDVFEANPLDRWPQYDRCGAVRFMRRLAGCDYGYRGAAMAALLHLPVVRMFVRANVDDRAGDDRPPFCSHACAMADRLGGGVDPVPHLADRLTEPSDLARSTFYRYRFTLVP